MSDGKSIPAGKFLGQVATEYNIMFQWDGTKWNRVPDYRAPENNWPKKIHFEPGDNQENEDAFEKAVRP